MGGTAGVNSFLGVSCPLVCSVETIVFVGATGSCFSLLLGFCLEGFCPMFMVPCSFNGCQILARSRFVIEKCLSITSRIPYIFNIKHRIDNKMAINKVWFAN